MVNDLEDLIARFRLVLDQLEAGEIDELPPRIFRFFYEYYGSSGEMPYGVMKARTDDPYVWVHQRLLADIRKTALF